MTSEESLRSIQGSPSLLGQADYCRSPGLMFKADTFFLVAVQTRHSMAPS